jgi:N-acyl-L-homoserine lactone synthetase
MSAVPRQRSAQTFAERVMTLLDRVDYRQAVSETEKDAVYRLRYEAYLRERAIGPSFARRLSDRFDDLDNCFIFGVFVEGRLVSSIRLHVTSRSYPDLPAAAVFSDILAPEIDAGRTIIDPTRFVVDYQAARAYPELPYVTTRIGWMAGEHFAADGILATVRTEHQAFYRRTFGHEVLAPARPYPTLIKPLSLMKLDYFGMKDDVHRRYPFFRSTAFERRMLFGGVGADVVWAVAGDEKPAEAAAAAAMAG